MLPIAELEKNHLKLVGKLRRFSFLESARLVGGLSLCPQLHENTLRLEALQHLVAISCKGQIIPKGSDLTTWFGLLNESPLAPYEDPVEDVFVGYINSEFGGFRVLRGIFSEADFWVERLLSFLSGKRDFPSFEETLQCSILLLKLSENLVDRVGLARYSPGHEKSAVKMTMPKWRIIDSCNTAVYFSNSELVQLGINIEIIKPFLFSAEDRSKLLSENLWNSSLERRPLIAEKDGLIVISPSNILRAVTRYLLERLTLSGIGGFGDIFFKSETSSIFVNEIANRMEVESLGLKPPEWPKGLPSMMPFFGFFDFGRPVVMLTHCTPLSKSAAEFDGHDRFSEDEQAKFQDYLCSCIAEIEKLPGFSGGLILVCLASVGRSMTFKFEGVMDGGKDV